MATSKDSSPSQVTPARWIATELGKRVVSAVVLGAATLLAAYQGGWIFTLFWLAAGIAVVMEWTSMSGAEPRLPLRLVLSAGLAVLTILYLSGAGLGLYVLVAALAIPVSAAIVRDWRNRWWITAGFIYAAVIVLVPPLVRNHPEFGLAGLLWMFAVVWATDVGAYFTGRSLGGPKLWSKVSPKKTWSGFVGGLVAGTLAGLLMAVVTEHLGWALPVDTITIGLLSAVASVLSQLGDLGESALKRKFNVKDSSHLIPGHGGVMDRLDGFWAVSVLVGVLFLTMQLGE